MPKRKRVDEEPNQRSPQRLSHSRNPNAFDALDEPVQKKVDEKPDQVESIKITNEEVGFKSLSCDFNSNASGHLEWTLGTLLEALADPNTHLVGVYGSDDSIKDTMLQRVNRRIQRDNIFDRLLTATVTKKPNVKKIQDELARQLGLTLNQKSKDKRANELIQRIKEEHKILIILRDVDKELDLSKVGIPYGADHTGCKILLTSTTEDVLSNDMHSEINFFV